ncbi:P-loop containing nucleoside triphosphate hydrolase protein [Zychaea mexicana]|uniref:P-loop containing nucleoside triphosphate hydrolase protein n=1 Tax=Zychaea mexicana TaxID=64656 RepID=UPI0022FDB0EA|nr:P-loop containing nucleoside triphosphate hydrolase protein [Zychaea mexicana]KAI9482551.1 P-loop containing nucleoside triphosphate hydrolase protein [Zychaea mexicana]
MDYLLQGIPFVGEFFALASTSMLTGSQHPSAFSGSTTDTIGGVPARTAAAWYAPFMNTLVTMLVLTVLPRIIPTITRWIYPGIRDYIHEIFYVSIQISQEEPIFYQIGQYVTQQQEASRDKKLTHVQGIAKNNEESRSFFHYLDEEVPIPRPRISVIPTSGTKQIVWHKGRKIFVTRRKVRAEDASASGLGTITLNDISSLLQRNQEVLDISMRGRDVEELKSIVQEWIDSIYNQDYNKLTVYQCMRTHSEYMWKRISNKEMRKYDSVVLREGQKEEILADVRKFLGAHKKYAMRGIPYRHAIILHGPPGTGKTSFIKGLSEKLRLNIAYISLATNLDDDGFLAMLARVPANSLIVMEDFDRSHITKDSKESDRNGGNAVMTRITEAGLLNALDGINTPEGTLVFMTCNDINKISDAVKRPGRVDQIYYLTYADDYQVEEMLWRFFGEGEQTIDPTTRVSNPELKRVAQVFLSHVRSFNSQMTTATLQKFFLEYEKEQEVQHWEKRKESKLSHQNTTVLTATKELSVKEKHNENSSDYSNDRKTTDSIDDNDEQQMDDFKIDLALLTDYDHVQRLLHKIQTETSAEDKIREDTAKLKKEQEERSKESTKEDQLEEEENGSAARELLGISKDEDVHKLIEEVNSDTNMGQSLRKLLDILNAKINDDSNSNSDDKEVTKAASAPSPPASPVTNGTFM